jgi:hypothetical protein
MLFKNQSLPSHSKKGKFSREITRRSLVFLSSLWVVFALFMSQFSHSFMIKSGDSSSVDTFDSNWVEVCSSHGSKKIKIKSPFAPSEKKTSSHSLSDCGDCCISLNTIKPVNIVIPISFEIPYYIPPTSLSTVALGIRTEYDATGPPELI